MVVKKSLAVFVICLLMLISIPPVASSEGEPDLDIKNIIIEIDYGHHPWPYISFYCRVKNIGNSPVEDTIVVTVRAYRCLFLLPIYYVDTFEGKSKLGCILDPGETIDIYFANDGFPRDGLYWFFAEVNPGKTIDESNYFNNYYIELALRIGPFWI